MYITCHNLLDYIFTIVNWGRHDRDRTVVGSTTAYYSTEEEGGILFYLCLSVRPSVRPRYFSSHFSQQLSMAEI